MKKKMKKKMKKQMKKWKMRNEKMKNESLRVHAEARVVVVDLYADLLIFKI